MFGEQERLACYRVARALFALEVADREGLQMARAELTRDPATQGAPHMAMIKFGPSDMGYPMADDLMPLIELWQPGSEKPESEFGITLADEAMDDAKAGLYDRLLNPSPPFALEVPVTGNPVLNRAYHDILVGARFAGRIASDSPEVKAARDFLFKETAEGLREESAIYSKFKEFQDRADELLLQSAQASNAGEAARADLIADRHAQLLVEWREMGHKAEVEAALALLDRSDKDAGFEDERTRFLQVLEAREKKRLDGSGLKYALVTLAPLAPLLDPEESGHWTNITLSGDFLKQRMSDDRLNSIFDLEQTDIDKALEFTSELSLSYTPLLLERDWLSEEFLRARYWRHDSKVLSDGIGGGEAPTVLRKAIFIRGAKLKAQFGVEAPRGPASSKGAALKFALYQPIKAPITAKLARLQSDQFQGLEAKLAPESARVLKNIASKSAREKERRATLNKGFKAQLASLQARNLKVAKLQPQAAKSLSAASKKTSVKAPVFKNLVNPNLNQLLVKKNWAAEVMDFRKKGNVTRVRAKPGRRVVPKPLPTPSTLTLSGRIDIAEDIDRAKVVLLLVRERNGATIAEAPVALTQRAGGLKFAIAVGSRWLRPPRTKNSARQRIELTHVSLRIFYEKEILDERKFAVSSTNRKEVANWTVRPMGAEVELSAAEVPTFYACALELMPKTPDPDEDLHWE